MNSKKLATRKNNGRTRYLLRVRASRLSFLENNVFNMIHELRHMAFWKCGDYESKHSTYDEYVTYNKAVRDVFDLLRLQQLVFNRFIDPTAYSSAKLQHGVRD